MVAMGLAPMLAPMMGAVPSSLYDLLTAAVYEVLIGLLIGSVVQLLMMGAQMAGAILDIQIGLGSIQIFNPQTQSPVRPCTGCRRPF